MRWLVLLLLVGCTDDDCLDGVCPSDETVARPGPCESAFSSSGFLEHCTYTYAGERLDAVHCDWHETGDDAEHGTDTASWTYDERGPSMIASEHLDFDEGLVDHKSKWTLDASTVTLYEASFDSSLRVARTYDRATFAFMPMVGTEVLSPRAELGLVKEGETTFAWSREGNTWTRTASTGAKLTIDVDDRGRVTAIAAPQNLETFTYDGDHLVGHVVDGHSMTYAYDRGGNIATWSASGAHETYAYSCW